MPRLDFWRRLFHHTALGLASACLLYAESFFLPGALLVVLYLLAGVQILAFAAEGRRWVLPSWAANLLAGAVAGGGVAWIAAELNRPDSVLASLPLPAGLLPYIGPILIGLLVVKLFRPPTPRDFWLLQGVGALQVALACVLATNPESGLLFGVLLALYLACALGRLALHYFEEEQRGGRSQSAGASIRPTADRMPFAYLMSRFCLCWSLAVVAVAAPFFLLTPRIQGPLWDSSVMAAAPRAEIPTARIGFSENIDLNLDGPVRLTDEEAFRVAVEATPGEPLPTLPADQYWRGSVLDAYDRGRWSNRGTKSPFGPRLDSPSPAPPLRPEQYHLDFTVRPFTGGFILAEPVLESLTPVESHENHAAEPQLVSTCGPVLPELYHGLRDYHYRQTVDPAIDPDRIPTKDGTSYTGALREQDVPGLEKWTSALLKRLADQPAYRLSPSDIRLEPDAPDTTPALQEKSRESVGRALAAYLARSGEYGYTLDLRRQDYSLDPVMDFLINTKQGHCERFASALALMLRSQGMPTRVVVGFHGATDPVDGVYVIHQNQAHAWVQMFEPGQPGHWITLDPTPTANAPAPISFSLWEWWRDGQRTSQQLWGGLIVNYDAEEQADLWTRLRSPTAIRAYTAAGLSLAVLAGAALTSVALRRRRRARRVGLPPAPAAAGYARLIALLARYAKLQPRVGQTPREFAAEAKRFLLAVPAAQPFADLPDEIVDQLYRTRYGGISLSVEENAVEKARLHRLTTALKEDGVSEGHKKRAPR